MLQVFPAGLAEGAQHIDAILRGSVRGLAEIRIRQIVDFDDLVPSPRPPKRRRRRGKSLSFLMIAYTDAPMAEPAEADI